MATNTEQRVKERKRTLILQKHILIVQVFFMCGKMRWGNDSFFGLHSSTNPVTSQWLPLKKNATCSIVVPLLSSIVPVESIEEWNSEELSLWSVWVIRVRKIRYF